MDKKPNEKFKQGMSVQEIENFGKKFRLELFYSVLFILARLFWNFDVRSWMECIP